MKRRLKALTLMVSALMLASCGNQEKAKYVFLFIGDGMGFTAVNATEAYKAYQRTGTFGNDPLAFTQFPVLGTASTYSASNPITCSSAAGTALSTGSKTKNNMLGMAPDSTDLTSITYKIHNSGYKVGVMTTVNIDHATPGSFYGHSVNRSDYYKIGSELGQTGFEFFGGGDFAKPKGNDNEQKDLFEMAEEAGYTIYYGLDEFNAGQPGDKSILFQKRVDGRSRTLFPMTLSRDENDMSLKDVVASAVKVLDNPKGFFMMVEGGQIDWAAHSNDLPNTIYETLDMDAAVALAYEFYLKHPKETLIVVTADHETGGLALGRNKYNYDISVVDQYKNSLKNLNVDNYMDDTMSVDEVSEKAEIGWTTRSHSGASVPVWAIGACSGKFAGRMDNTDIPKRICEAMGVKF